MKPLKRDKSGKILDVGDLVMFDGERFIIKYGNYTYIGVDRIGLYMEKCTYPHIELPVTSKVEKLD